MRPLTTPKSALVNSPTSLVMSTNSGPDPSFGQEHQNKSEACFAASQLQELLERSSVRHIARRTLLLHVLSNYRSSIKQSTAWFKVSTSSDSVAGSGLGFARPAGVCLLTDISDIVIHVAADEENGVQTIPYLTLVSSSSTLRRPHNVLKIRVGEVKTSKTAWTRLCSPDDSRLVLGQLGPSRPIITPQLIDTTTCHSLASSWAPDGVDGPCSPTCSRCNPSPHNFLQ
ncbi:hypothetical protein B0J18DRAFT_20962 [Chaetomium sp. MPI-SDFR-AT-0129]|nr:hypothetical protein B0J18DRAFT_20962 [Chaetomium sp. MPI-SDFR-AT-0129]